MSENAILMAESRAADHAGDEDAAWAWLALAELPGVTKQMTACWRYKYGVIIKR